MEATGKIEKILPVVSGTTKSGDSWQKQIFLLRTEDEYDNLLPIEAFGKAMEHMNKLSVGQEATVHFNIKCNEYQGKYYTSLGLWKVEVKGSAPAPPPAAPKSSSEKEAAFENAGNDGSDDLPF